MRGIRITGIFSRGDQGKYRGNIAPAGGVWPTFGHRKMQYKIYVAVERRTQ